MEHQVYSGGLYPFDANLECDPEYMDLQSNVKSLVDICCAKVVADSTTTRQAVAVVPRELFDSLMKAALRLDKDRAVEVLVGSWPWPTLCLQKLAPKLVDSLRVLHDPGYAQLRMRLGVKFTTCLVQTFVECLKKRIPTKLRCLDLSGYPTAEIIVSYLSSHVLLGCNEARQREIIRVYDHLTHSLPHIHNGRYELNPTLPSGKFMVRLDVSLRSTEVHMEVCRALRHSKSHPDCLHLEVRGLELTSMGAARVSVLLGEAKKESINSLSLQYNGLSSDGLTLLSPQLCSLGNLSNLDLSRNGTNLVKNDTASQMMAKTFSSLPHLTHLNLCSTWTKNKLSVLLGATQRPLLHLNLSGCGLSRNDVVYLQRSQHANSLEVLDISQQVLEQSGTALVGLLTALAPTLQILEMESVSIPEEDWVTVFVHCHVLAQLRYWNIADNPLISKDLLVDLVAQLVKMPQLQVIRTSFPNHLPTVPEGTQSEQQHFQCLYNRFVLASCLQADRKQLIRVLLVGDETV